MEVYLFHFNTCQDLALLEIGDQQCAPLYSFGPYIRNEYIFHFIVSGKGYVLLNTSDEENPEVLSDRIELRAGEGFLLEPQTKHMYAADERDPWHYIWIVFTGLSVQSYLHSCGITRRDPVFRPKDYTEKTVAQMREPLRCILERPKASKAYIIGQLHLFFNSLMENAAISAAASAPEISIANIYIAEATRYIHNQYASIRSLDEIAAYCNITRTHLARLFKSTLNMTLQEYLIEYRISKAKELLINTNFLIYQISEMVGYEDSLNFNKAFKSRTRMPPRTWRVFNKARLEIE